MPCRGFDPWWGDRVGGVAVLGYLVRAWADSDAGGAGSRFAG